MQDKSETEKVDVELEERKFEPSANDRDLVEILGRVLSQQYTQTRTCNAKDTEEKT